MDKNVKEYISKMTGATQNERVQQAIVHLLYEISSKLGKEETKTEEVIVEAIAPKKKKAKVKKDDGDK